jgi:hypothetical protein
MKGAHEISALHESERHGNWGHHQGSHNYGELVQERTIALVILCAQEQALVFFSQQHDGHQAQYNKCQHQERHKGGSPGAASDGGCVHEVLAAAWHLALRGLAKVDGYVCQEEAQDGDRQTPCPGKVKGGEICTYLL